MNLLFCDHYFKNIYHLDFGKHDSTLQLSHMKQQDFQQNEERVFSSYIPLVILRGSRSIYKKQKMY